MTSAEEIYMIRVLMLCYVDDDGYTMYNQHCDIIMRNMNDVEDLIEDRKLHWNSLDLRRCSAIYPTMKIYRSKI